MTLGPGSISHIVIFLVRCGLVVLFLPSSALDKIFNFKGAEQQALQVFSSRRLAAALILAGLFTEIVMPLGVVTGIADRLAAFILAGYSAVTAVLFKRFWEPGDFWSPGESKARTLFWDFLKNLSLASGFLLITVGVDGHSWRAFVGDPLASSLPYAALQAPR